MVINVVIAVPINDLLLAGIAAEMNEQEWNSLGLTGETRTSMSELVGYSTYHLHEKHVDVKTSTVL